jgi:presenilin-like A22 family membrane protease
MKPRALGGVAFATVLFLLIQFGALVLVPTFAGDPQYQTVENVSDPTNSLLYFGAILVATVLMLAAFRFDLDRLVRWVIVFTSGLLAWYVFEALLSPVPGLVLAAGVAIGLLAYPEWYVIDAAGVLMGAGAAGLFGINFGLLPAVVLLSVLAIYDAISVYGTEHMLDLAEGVMDLHIPVVLVIPLSLSYSVFEPGEEAGDDEPRGDEAEPGGAKTRADDDLAEATDPESEEREASADSQADRPGLENRDVFFVGLGDAVIPTVLVASAAQFAAWAPGLGIAAVPALNLPALLAMVGTLLGLFVLLAAVMRGRAHAGLPLLNGGALAGYLLGAVLTGGSLLQALGLAPYV